jgi:ABC-type sugar transport system ATPase subunit
VEVLLDIRDLTKRFPGAPVNAVDSASLTVRAGEVHGLVGENGAGKSTVVKIIAGAVRRTSGTILVDGREVAIANEREASALGFEFLHQDVGLVERMTVAENIALGRRLPTRAGIVSPRRAREQARRALEGLSDVDPRASIGALSVAERWLVGIARARARDARLVVLDEPTVALTDSEVERVFGAIDELRSSGTAVIFVSHRLAEVLRLSDRVTVMKDGQVVATHDVAELDRTKLVEAIVGHEVGKIHIVAEPVESGEPVLEVEALAGGAMRSISFTLHAGEVLGVGGLVGSGRTSLLTTIFGLHRPESGTIRLGGEQVAFHSPADAVAAGIALIPEDRHMDALFPARTVRENLVIAHLRLQRAIPRLPIPSRRHEHRVTHEMQQRLQIVMVGPEQEIFHLSGGNQQKVVLGRWAVGGPRVVMLDEPTKGIDVGAKAEVLLLARRLAAEGAAVIFVSSDLEEVAEVADRVLVINEGRGVAELRSPVTEADILRLCYAAPVGAGADADADADGGEAA